MKISRNDRGYRIGQSHPRARYSDHEVELVRDLRDQGWTYSSIARKLEMPKSTVAEILEGRIRCQQPCVEAGGKR